MKKYNTVYLDWDGVLWDFKQAFCDWQGIEAPDTVRWEFYESLSMTADKFHEILSGLPQEFWQQEKYLLPHAHKLVKWARDNAEEVFILTVAPEWTTSQAKQNLAHKHFDLNVYTVAKAEEKIEFAKKGCLLIDDKDSTVIRFAREISGAGGGFVWPANYNKGLDPSWYFNLSWLENVEEPSDTLGIDTHKWADVYAVDSKPVLDYDAMDEAKRRKMTPMYSGLLAYFPDALALVARNSMVGHYQHNDPKDPMYWDRTKSADEMDAMIRHMADHSKNPRDKDGTLHMSKVAWRALAFVQKFIEEEQNDCI
ncbi:DUF5664 domain-containing protein [bacterium]|nr:DUF5664 domain-containing protein [bacterium]